MRITQSCLLSGTRFSIAIPAQGIEELRDALTDLIEEYGEGYLDGVLLINNILNLIEFCLKIQLYSIL